VEGLEGEEKRAGEKEGPHGRASCMAPPIETENVFNVFQPGLRRGSARMPYSPKKRYFYVEHPTEGWRVYLRSACFMHPMYEPFNAAHFLVVKRTGGKEEKASWEPPKGQMEFKDTEGGGGRRRRNVYELLCDNIRREVDEEAKISKLRELRHTGIVVQSREPDYPPNVYFQYHVFTALVHPAHIYGAFHAFDWYEQNKEAFDTLPADQREKDAIAWADEGDKKKMMGRWAPTIVKLYLKQYGDHPDRGTTYSS